MGLIFRQICQGDHFFWEGDLVKFVSQYVVAWIAPTFVDQYTRNFGKLSVIVKTWMVLIFRKICQGDHFFGEGGLSYICVILCCRLDSSYICWSIYMKLWEVVNNNKSMDGIDFQKNLSWGSLFWDADLVEFLLCCHLYSSFFCWLIYMKL